MRLHELEDNDQPTTPEANLLTALELLRNRYKEKGLPAKIKTQSLINLVLNTDKNFDYNALVAANKNNTAVQNLIKSFDQDTVTIKTSDDSAGEMTTNVKTDPTAPLNTVDSMAKRAAKQRSSSIF